uniref:DNA topoisomerase 1 n=2 Tax=environmental samples TaxID=651140 RepID=A0A075GHP2_9ARCH|nr:2-alkenal reductase (TOP1) [uncultured marine thaumarchaeote KM3_167_H09]AIF12441.1 2-alkenal reductase (TOP1) [uncultured marine thaumarchaeote KM3_55_G04]
MKWKTLQHNGILFPPDFESKGIKIKINGQNIVLTLEQEEMIYQWAKKKDAPKPGTTEKYIEDSIFQKNFVSDFAKTYNGKFKNLQYTDIDFSQAFKLVDKEKEVKELMTKEEKKALAAERKKIREKMKIGYGMAIMDGKEVEIANYMAEPPGIFMGRGEHPMRGRYKPRTVSKDVTLNLGKEAKVPEGNWGKIVHDKNSMWIANWMDILTQKRKYVWLADTAGIKQDRDQAKYDKAKKLAKEIENVKARIIKDMQRNDPKTRKISTACYLIYRTAMRVGDEKDPDEADTVGATTLRKEHIKLTENTIEFDFLGKDSVRWQETIPAEGQDKQFHSNLKELTSNKKNNQEIFDDITSRHVNVYYSTIVKGLTAKVFRTYLASSVVSKYLRHNDNIKSESPMKKLFHAKLANLNAAIMCNHKRTIPKNFEQTLQKKKDVMSNLEKAKPWQKSEVSLKKAQTKITKTDKENEKQKERIKKTKSLIKKRKEKHKERIEKLQIQIDLVQKTRDYNLGTSLRNYIDPRIFKTWTDEVGAEWEKLYTSALQKKFLWVKTIDSKWSEISKQY